MYAESIAELRTDITVEDDCRVRLKTAVAYYRDGHNGHGDPVRRVSPRARGYQGVLGIDDDLGIEMIWDGLCDLLAQVTQNGPREVRWIIVSDDGIPPWSASVVWVLVCVLAHEFEVSVLSPDRSGVPWNGGMQFELWEENNG